MKKLMILFLSLIFILSGCANDASDSEGYLLYYLSEDGLSLLDTSCQAKAGDGTAAWVEEMREKLNNGEDVPAQGKPLLTESTQISSAVNVSGIITVDIGKGYYSLSTADQLLLRAGITKTFVQSNSISAVVLYVDGEPAKDPTGNELLPMRANTFVDENADGIANHRSIRMTLYFTDETGTKLKTETREVHYSVNTPIEQAVLNELIAGPSSSAEGLYRTLPPELNVLNVTIQDDICYVNFDESLENSTFEMDPAIQIYSIVDSIAHVCNVDSVVFSVNGSSNILLKKDIDLSRIFSPDEYYTGIRSDS